MTVLDAWLVVRPGPGPPERVANLLGYVLPGNRAVVLWSLALADALLLPNPPNPQGDLVLDAACRGAAALLHRRLPEAAWLLTPGIATDYPAPAWHAFLAGRGYQSRTPAGRGRALPGAPGRQPDDTDR